MRCDAICFPNIGKKLGKYEAMRSQNLLNAVTTVRGPVDAPLDVQQLPLELRLRRLEHDARAGLLAGEVHEAKPHAGRLLAEPYPVDSNLTPHKSLTALRVY